MNSLQLFKIVYIYTYLVGNMNTYRYSGLHRNSYHSCLLISIFDIQLSLNLMTKEINRKCVLKTKVKQPRGILFLSQLQKYRDIALEEIACYQNLIDEINEVINEFLEIDRKKNFSWERLTRCDDKPFTHHSIWTLASLGNNLMVLLKSYPTYTWW